MDNNIPVKVFIDHGEHLIAAGLTLSLSGVPGITLLAGRHETPPPQTDVLITDHERGLRLAPMLRDAATAGRSQTRVMIVSANDREHDIKQALLAGVYGVVHSHCTADEVVRAVRSVAAQGRYLCPSMTQRVADSMTHESLTARETDVLRLLVLGHSNKAIALSLRIAVGTVKAHVKSIMEKLDAHTRTHAVSVATARGLVSFDGAPMPAAPLAARAPAMGRPRLVGRSDSMAA